MKLLTCEYMGRAFAAVSDGTTCWEAAPDMNALIDSLGGRLTAPELMSAAGIPLASVRLCAPIVEPRQDVLCLGMNYNDHSVEAARWGKENFVRNEGKAVYFSKRAARIAGPSDDIIGHFDMVDGLDYEAELAVILGRDAYNVPMERAFDYVLGYSVINDVSARNLQREHKQFYFGKSLDTHTVMGPWIVTRDELPTPPVLPVRCYVNGELRQNGNSADMIFDIPYIISDLTRGMTLRAGTVIATGTPAGVGMGFIPPKYLSAGDVVRCEIEGVGAIENRVV